MARICAFAEGKQQRPHFGQSLATFVGQALPDGTNSSKLTGKEPVPAREAWDWDMGIGVRRAIWAILAIWLGLVSQALAEPRIALVIGNGAYRSVNGLPNPPNDAKLMAETLKGVGFQVTLVADGDMATMGAAVSAFGSALREAGPDATGLFYYAGHGVQSFGRNYLVPVDAKLTNAADLSLVAIDAQSVLIQMASTGTR